MLSFAVTSEKYQSYTLGLEKLVQKWSESSFLENFSSSRPEVFCKKDALQNSQILQKNTCTGFFF